MGAERLYAAQQQSDLLDVLRRGRQQAMFLDTLVRAVHSCITIFMELLRVGEAALYGFPASLIAFPCATKRWLSSRSRAPAIHAIVSNSISFVHLWLVQRSR